MNTAFKQLVDKYMLNHTLKFQEYITQTKFYDENGSPNIEYITEQAKRDAVRLKDMLDEESMILFRNQVLNAVEKNDNKTVLYLLFFYFIVCLNSMPRYTALLASNKNTFDIYCKALPDFI